MFVLTRRAGAWLVAQREWQTMSKAWTVKDTSGNLLEEFTSPSRLEVALKVVRRRYDCFRLQVSSSYREVFDRDVDKALAHYRWQIVKVPKRAALSQSMNI